MREEVQHHSLNNTIFHLLTRIFLLKAYFVSIQIPILLPYAGIIRFK